MRRVLPVLALLTACHQDVVRSTPTRVIGIADVGPVQQAAAPAPTPDRNPRSAKPTLRETCQASWYAEGLTQPDRLTAASRTFPRGTRLRTVRGSRSVSVLVNDYGPARRTGRCLDLSRGAFRELAPLSRGVITVHIERAA